ncbi:ATP-binding protein [Kitasatospora sp. NBC_00085]|uniref:ATP-binding protein n=2 Tax=unclassified Kitasatospora TaxID=2633591 RepID=UPI00324FD247
MASTSSALAWLTATIPPVNASPIPLSLVRRFLMCAFNPPDWSAARAELRDALAAASWPDDLIQDAELALCELYVNAWRHGGSPAPLVVVLLLNRTLRVSVADDSPTLPEPVQSADPYELSGRGLHLVRSLTHRFGTNPRKHGGKAVWFELEAAA